MALPFYALRQFQPGINRLLRRLFEDAGPSRTIRYKLYKGLSPDTNGDATATYQEFSIPALLTGVKTSALSVNSGVSVDEMTSDFMVRPSDFPKGVTVDDLSPNDRITYGGKDFAVMRINRSIPFVVQLSVCGE